MAKQVPGKNIRVKLIVEGEIKDVMDVVQLAMAGNLMKEYSVDEEHLSVVDAKDFLQDEGRRNTRKRDFQVGDRVKANGRSERYGLEGGEVGTITKVFYRGRRSKVEVRWDDNTESECGGSVLDIVRTAK